MVGHAATLSCPHKGAVSRSGLGRCGQIPRPWGALHHRAAEQLRVEDDPPFCRHPAQQRPWESFWPGSAATRLHESSSNALTITAVLSKPTLLASPCSTPQELAEACVDGFVELLLEVYAANVDELLGTAPRFPPQGPKPSKTKS